MPPTGFITSLAQQLRNRGCNIVMGSSLYVTIIFDERVYGLSLDFSINKEIQVFRAGHPMNGRYFRYADPDLVDSIMQYIFNNSI